MGRQWTQRLRRVLLVQATHQQCTTGGCSTHGKLLDRWWKPSGQAGAP
ncbi:MAG: hypothetical protein ACJ8DI_00735 [Ktedonobacteraceae bacterium]